MNWIFQDLSGVLIFRIFVTLLKEISVFTFCDRLEYFIYFRFNLCLFKGIHINKSTQKPFNNRFGIWWTESLRREATLIFPKLQITVK